MNAAPTAGPQLSKTRVHDGIIYASGAIGRESDGSIPADFARQTRLAIDDLEHSITAAGGSLATVLKTTVFIVEQAAFGEMNAIYAERFSEPLPARSTIVTGMALPELLFEIEAIAYVE
jgi:2-iminobutanoate/2-iminopropanoate deaminase